MISSGVQLCFGVILLLQLTSMQGFDEKQFRNSIREQLQRNAADVQRIMDYVLEGAGKHNAFDRLTYITDRFGHRYTGEASLEQTIDYVAAELETQGFDNVVKEPFDALLWRRGHNDTATLHLPHRRHPMQILSLGSSVGTVGGSITAPAIVVRDFDELTSRADEAEGKIVVYNQAWIDYGYTNQYRTQGAARAAEVGAVAALVRSVTGYSIYTPHTGQQNYEAGIEQIPVACVTVEDAELMQRLHDRGETFEVELYMDCMNDGTTETRNVVAEIVGETIPSETVVFGGHIDSWDVGLGAMDDLAGVIITWESMLIMKALGLHPRRTVRSVFWSAEEIGLVGADAYFEQHKDEQSTISLMMESDGGTFRPHGVGFTGSYSARLIMQEVLAHLSSINAHWVGPDGSQPDTGVWQAVGVPVASLWNDAGKYFDYHHTHADAPTMQDPDDLDLCTIVWATTAYLVADLEDMLPRDVEPTDEPTPSAANALGPLTAYTGLLALLSLLSRRQ